MENLTHALYMAFAMIVFVVAFSVALYLVSQVNSTAKTIVYNLDTSYYDSFELRDVIGEDNEEKNRSRIVGVDTIIPTLYRYYKESFAVKILDVDGSLLQMFDTTIEGDVNSAISSVHNEDGVSFDDPNYDEYSRNKALLSLYDVDTSGKEKSFCYMFGVPWLANINKDAKTRIDLYISGGKGYINNTLVDYSRKIGPGSEADKKYVYLNYYKDRKFRETFTQYAYEGDTITDENNGEPISLTGNRQIATKIIIIYQLLP